MIDIKVPTVGESITEVTISKWLKKTGDYVEMDEPIAELESDKATFELPAEKAGKLEVIMEEGSDAKVGEIVARIDESAPAPAKTEAPKEKPVQEKEASPKTEPAAPAMATKENPQARQEEKTTYAAGHPSPAAAKLMKENNLTPGQIKGSGKDGRITSQDVLSLLASGIPLTTSLQPAAFSREEKREKMSRLRQTISKRLVSVKNETAMLTTFNDVDMSAILDLRKIYKDAFKEKHGINLGFMSFFTRACALALQQFPAVNARIDGQEIVYHDFTDISIAVSTPRGLVVPVIRNAESLTMAQIEQKVIELAVKARDNKLSLEEMDGGTFSITNGGVFGSLLSTPIINGNQSAILGMHRIEERPVALNGQVVIRPMMYLALSYDHRIIDGKESVSFLKTVKELLENPARLLTGSDPAKLLFNL